MNNSELNKTLTIPNGGDNGYLLASFICACLIVVVAVWGIIGNVLSFCVFTKSSNISSINILLAGQAVMDIALLVLATPLSSTMGISTYMPNNVTTCSIHVLVYYSYPFAMMAQTSTVWATVVITCERFLAVCRPFKALTLCTTKNAKRALVSVTFSSIIYNICRFWEFKLLPKCELLYLLRDDPTFVKVYYNWLYFLIVFLIPFILLAILNWQIIKTINVARQRRKTNRKQNREYQTSVMMVVFTCAFLICNSLAFVLKAYDAACFQSQSEKFCNIDDSLYTFLIDLNNLLVEFNSSIPFLVYVSFSSCFRQRFLRMLNKFYIFYYNLTPCLINHRYQEKHRLSSSYRISFTNNGITTQLISQEKIGKT